MYKYIYAGMYIYIYIYIHMCADMCVCNNYGSQSIECGGLRESHQSSSSSRPGFVVIAIHGRTRARLLLAR